jgi:hypothetical protein
MRTSKFYKLLASTVLVAAFTITSTDTFAQRRSNEDERTRYEERNKNTRMREYDRRDKYNKSEYRHRDHHKNHKHEYKHKKHRDKHYHKRYSHRDRHYNNHCNGHVTHRHYHGDHYRHHRKHHYPHYRYKHFYNDFGHSCYRHNRYGDVVVRFGCEPRVIRHRHVDYYYASGCYYRFYPEVGYVRVEAPRSVYFSYVPDECRRVVHRGNVYYIDGDLCFMRHNKGFRLVTAPTGIHLSFKF